MPLILIEADHSSKLSSIKEILKPLTIANNVTQATHTQLDYVSLTLGNLYHIYSNNNFNATIQDKILGSLEKRWATADQDIFILAIFLNPYICHCCFSTTALSHADIYNMAEHVYHHVFKEDVGLDFLCAFMDYYNEEGEYLYDQMKLDMLKAKLDTEVCDLAFAYSYQGVFNLST